MTQKLQTQPAQKADYYDLLDNPPNDRRSLLTLIAGSAALLADNYPRHRRQFTELAPVMDRPMPSTPEETIREYPTLPPEKIHLWFAWIARENWCSRLIPALYRAALAQMPAAVDLTMQNHIETKAAADSDPAGATEQWKRMRFAAGKAMTAGRIPGSIELTSGPVHIYNAPVDQSSRTINAADNSGTIIATHATEIAGSQIAVKSAAHGSNRWSKTKWLVGVGIALLGIAATFVTGYWQTHNSERAATKVPANPGTSRPIP